MAKAPLKPTFRWNAKSMENLQRKLDALKGSAIEIVGRLTENMFYAIYQEFGTVRAAARPHMRPAHTEMRPLFLRIMGKAIDLGSLRGNIDQILEAAMVGAMFEFERLRQQHLVRQIYTSERYALQAEPGYSGYVLTQNLLKNRTIDIYVDKILKNSPPLPAVGGV